MADLHTHAADSHEQKSHYLEYWRVFIILCVCTASSFVLNWGVGRALDMHLLSAGLIMLVAVVKAYFVIVIFMHLKQDWGMVYPIMIPVVIMSVMTIIILSIDTVFAIPLEQRPDVSMTDLKLDK